MAHFDCQSKPNHITKIGAIPTIGNAEIKLPNGKRPLLRKLNLSIAIAVRKAEPQPKMYPDRAPFTKV